MKAHASMTREFSTIAALQKPYALTYELDSAGAGCRLTLTRSGQAACRDSLVLDAPPLYCYAVLQYLYENCVQPEIWRDVVGECCPAGGKGVAPDE